MRNYRVVKGEYDECIVIIIVIHRFYTGGQVPIMICRIRPFMIRAPHIFKIKDHTCCQDARTVVDKCQSLVMQKIMR